MASVIEEVKQVIGGDTDLLEGEPERRAEDDPEEAEPADGEAHVVWQAEPGLLDAGDPYSLDRARHHRIGNEAEGDHAGGNLARSVWWNTRPRTG